MCAQPFAAARSSLGILMYVTEDMGRAWQVPVGDDKPTGRLAGPQGELPPCG